MDSYATFFIFLFMVDYDNLKLNVADLSKFSSFQP